jgi:hypothetical protein
LVERFVYTEDVGSSSLSRPNIPSHGNYIKPLKTRGYVRLFVAKLFTNGFEMAGTPRYLLNRNGLYFARLVVPKDLREIVGKTELREPLGPDRREALRLLPGAVTQLQHRIAVAEREAGAGMP